LGVIEGALACIRFSDKTSFMPKKVKQLNKADTDLISGSYTIFDLYRIRYSDRRGCP
jgi:hypothetical protein